MYFLLLRLFFVQEIGATDVKTWTANTNFDNPRNWRDGRLPCANDRIIFPNDAKLISFMSAELSFAEMILPMDGELVFGDGSNVVITGGKQDESCPGTDMHFATFSDYWYDVVNWNITSPNAYPDSGASRKNLAVPHALQIPCQFDKVVFPKDTSFKADLDGASVSIGAIEINGIKYNHDEVQDLLSSRTGNLLFPGSSKLTISGRGCNDPSGCKCSNDEPQVMVKICRRPRCPELECHDSVTPTGHCCPVCGAYLEMEHSMDFQIKKLVDFFKSNIAKPYFSEVESFTFKTYKDTIQAVFIDGGKSKGAASEIAKMLRKTLAEEIGGSNSYRLRAVKAFVSEDWNDGVPTHSPRGGRGLSGGSVVAIIFVILCVVGIAVAWYIYKKRQIPGFDFARFDLHASKVELELGTTPHKDLDAESDSVVSFPGGKTPEDPEIDKAFDNPIYDAAVDSGKSKNEENSENVGDIVENPMFMLFENP